ncbi:polyamine aminopropyltransferase [Amedibacillus sp. YH-ame6]
MTDLWYSEYHTKNVKFSMRLKKQLHSFQSPFQQIDVFDTYEFGRVLTLDGVIMLTEKDEFIYHEMITHVAMASNPNIKKILIIGAGDGGTIKRLCAYPYVEQMDVVEIDQDVVRISKEYFPSLASSFDDSRVHLYFEDGLRFVRNVENMYDLIIVDSTDPFGPGEGLFTKEFYGNCFNALKEQGILINQMESPYYQDDAQAMKRAFRCIKSRFPIALAYQAHIPTYPSGHWMFGFASKHCTPFDSIEEWEKLGIVCEYYTTKLHRGCFALPRYVEIMLEEA